MPPTHTAPLFASERWITLTVAVLFSVPLKSSTLFSDTLRSSSRIISPSTKTAYLGRDVSPFFSEPSPSICISADFPVTVNSTAAPLWIRAVLPSLKIFLPMNFTLSSEGATVDSVNSPVDSIACLIATRSNTFRTPSELTSLYSAVVVLPRRRSLSDLRSVAEYLPAANAVIPVRADKAVREAVKRMIVFFMFSFLLVYDQSI